MRTVESAISGALAGAISEITQRTIFNRLGPLARRPVAELGEADRRVVMSELESSVRLFARGRSPELVAACARVLSGATVKAGEAPRPRPAARTLPIELERDIASARLEAWSEAVRIGLSKFTSVKVATAVSELARNIVFYAGRGKIELLAIPDGGAMTLQIVASDQGPGIEPGKLEEIFAGTYRSQRGMGKGLAAVKKLVDRFQIDTAPGRGTVVSCAFRGDR